jgi:nicotinamide-nucleotide amidase
MTPGESVPADSASESTSDPVPELASELSSELPSADSIVPGLDGVHARARELLHVLRESGTTIGAAESITGGLLGAALTDIPGASESFIGAVVSYATYVKQEVLGVDSDLLDRRGAVEAQVAEQMAAGVRRLLSCDYAVATTGVAGPGSAPGGRERAEVPAGEVYIAVAGPWGGLVEQLHIMGDRDHVRQEVVRAALSLVTRQIRRDRLNRA